MNSVFIDESGYTGADLLNQDQPFQAASALYISDADAVNLIAKHFPKIKSEELKYRDLARRQTNWNSLLSLQIYSRTTNVLVIFVINGFCLYCTF